MQDIFQFKLAHKNIITEVPMFGLRRYPGCFQSVILLEDGVCEDERVICSEPYYIITSFLNFDSHLGLNVNNKL